MNRKLLSLLIAVAFCPALVAQSLTIPLSGENEVLNPSSRCLQVDSRKRIYLADRQSSRILVFSAEGRLLHRLGGPGEGPGEFKRWFGRFALSADDRLLQADFWGGNRSLSCFSVPAKLLWVHKIQKDGYFGTEEIYPLADGRLILGIGHSPMETAKGNLLYIGSHLSFYLACEDGSLGNKLIELVNYHEVSDPDHRGGRPMPYVSYILSALDPVRQRLAFQKSNEDRVHILDIAGGRVSDHANGFTLKPLSAQLVRAKAREIMSERGRERDRPLYKKLIENGATIESTQPIVDALVYTDSGELLIAASEPDSEDEENEKQAWTFFTLGSSGNLSGPYQSDRFPSVVRQGLAYYLQRNEAQDRYEIRVEPWKN